MLSHNELGAKGYTLKYRPWEILFIEEYQTKREAMVREKALKGGKGREFIWQQIKERGLLSA